LTSALGRDWADVLESLPQDAIQKACVQFLRDNPRKRPTPGAIYELARSHIPKPERKRSASVVSIAPERERISAERAAQIMRDAGFAPRKFGDMENE
jgi:hypothetical protein